MTRDRPDGPAQRPALRVIRGDATAEEIAAILAVVSSRAARAQTTRAQTDRRSAARGGWNDRSAAMRSIPVPGPGAWRSSSWMQ